MLVTCWSVKGGSGTTVVAAALALLIAERNEHTWLVDLAGDAPAALGAAEPCGPGIGDWLAAPESVGTEAISRLGVAVGPRLTLLPVGEHRHPSADSCRGRWQQLASFLAGRRAATVVDAGSDAAPHLLRAGSSRDLLVVRSCYLAMRRVAQLRQRPREVILVHEPGRSLRRPELEHAMGAPLVAEVEWDPSVARAIDAGLLAGAMPRSLRGALEGVAWQR